MLELYLRIALGVVMVVLPCVMAAVLLYVVFHKRPVVNNVGLADPSTWHAQPQAGQAAIVVAPPAVGELAPGIVAPPVNAEPQQAADQW